VHDGRITKYVPLNFNAIQTYGCNLVGRYIFIVVSAAKAAVDNNALNFLELQAFSACMTCPLHSNAPPESVWVVACVCNPGYTGPNGGPCSQCATGKFKVWAYVKLFIISMIFDKFVQLLHYSVTTVT